jgi:hypothetical protein
MISAAAFVSATAIRLRGIPRRAACVPWLRSLRLENQV